MSIEKGEAVNPHTTDSEGYPDDSERYQEEEDYPWLREERPASGSERELGADWMPDSALAEALGDPDGLEPNRREWQINVRLDRPRYAMLKKAADVYGTTPTALENAPESRRNRDPEHVPRRDDCVRVVRSERMTA